MNLQLNGLVAVVTGGSRGIGLAICKALAAEGADVAVLYASNAEKAEAAAAACAACGVRAKAYPCRVENSTEAAQTVKDILADFGRIDILVNNAGITRDKLVNGMRDADFDDVIDVNLRGAFHMLRAVYPLMAKQRSGRILNISSVAGLSGNAGQTNYAASKAGLIGMTKSAARELAARGVTCNAIAPGFIATDMTEKFAQDEKTLAAIPVRRMGTPDEVAALAAYLCSPHAAYITGEVIRIDGGMMM
ncbi:MAG: 3-oxoacyl-[acyl-carrier-protein] reductase [Ruminococcaceae bacterium]|nr:3-oxoacyl-[acyl-carrier-protein] reductase [Oscillospiraceae bacterium]